MGEGLIEQSSTAPIACFHHHNAWPTAAASWGL